LLPRRGGQGISLGSSRVDSRIRSAFPIAMSKSVSGRLDLSSRAMATALSRTDAITGGHTRTAPRGAKGCAGTVWDDRSLVNSLGQLLQLGREERERARIARATPNDSLRA